MFLYIYIQISDFFLRMFCCLALVIILLSFHAIIVCFLLQPGMDCKAPKLHR